MMKRYKVLNADMTTPYQKMPMEVGELYTADLFDPDPEKDCAPGLYATKIEGLVYAYRPGQRVFLCEVSGRKVEFNTCKCRYERMKLLRELTLPEVLAAAKKAEKRCGFILSEALFPVSPLMLQAGPVTEKEIELLKQWASVWASARDSVRDSVWASVWDSVWAYIGSLFPGVETWKYFKHAPGVYPFQPAADLWRRGFVPVFHSGKWRLLAGNPLKEVYVLDGGE